MQEFNNINFIIKWSINILTIRFFIRADIVDTWTQVEEFNLSSEKQYDITEKLLNYLNNNNYLRVSAKYDSSGKWYNYYFYKVLKDQCILKGKDLEGNEKIYYGILNYEESAPITTTTSSVINTLNSKTPFIVNNIEQQYYTGSVSATFAESNEDTEWGYDFENALIYREELKQWLCNRLPKILELSYNKKLIIKINGDIEEQRQSHDQNIIISFNWVELDEYTLENLNKYELI